MAIILVPQPGSTPSDLTDWTDSVESLKQYNLGVNNPVDYNFDGNTIKKGVLITIGGSNYYCNADTAISGTASDYVKITSAGVASYVSSLSGVSWNDTYNFYADSSGNAYIFNEAKAGLANTVIGAFAKEAYFTSAIFTSSVGDTVKLGAYGITSGSADFEIYNSTDGVLLALWDSSHSLHLNNHLYIDDKRAIFTSSIGDDIILDAYGTTLGSADFEIYNSTDGVSLALWDSGHSLNLDYDLNLGGAINPTTTTTIGAGVTITSAGSASFAEITLSSSSLDALTINRMPGKSSIRAGSTGAGDMLIDSYTSSGVLALNYYSEGNTAINANSGRTLIGTLTDNGVDKLQVNGSMSVSGDAVFGDAAASSVEVLASVSGEALALYDDSNSLSAILRSYAISGVQLSLKSGGIDVNGSASFSGAINPTSTTTIGAGVTITAAGALSTATLKVGAAGSAISLIEWVS